MARPKGSKRTPLAIQAELMELYYTGDPISEHKLANQFGLARSGVHEVLQKYFPKKTDRDVIMIIPSKINKMRDVEPDQIQESLEED